MKEIEKNLEKSKGGFVDPSEIKKSKRIFLVCKKYSVSPKHFILEINASEFNIVYNFGQWKLPLIPSASVWSPRLSSNGWIIDQATGQALGPYTRGWRTLGKFSLTLILKLWLTKFDFNLNFTKILIWSKSWYENINQRW